MILLFFPPDFKCIFSCIVQDSLYHNMDIGTMWHCALFSCTSSQSVGLVLESVLFWCWVSLCVPITNSLIEIYFIMIVVTIIENFIFHFIIYILNYMFRFSVTEQFWFGKCAPPWMFPPLDIAFEYWIEHVTFGHFYVMFRLSTRVFYMGFTGFATDCPCGVWGRGLTTCLLYVGPLGNLGWNDSGFVNLTW